MTEPLTREQLILKYIPQVEKWVKGWVAKNPDASDRYDDLIGEANLKLVEIVDAHLDGKIGLLEHYLRLSILTAATDFIRADSVIPTRSKTPPVFEPLHYWAAFETRLTETQASEATVAALTKLFDATRDIKDVAIVQAKLDGAKTLDEVAERTGIPKDTAKKRLRQIFNRVKHE